MTEHHPTYFEARNVYQRLADLLPLVGRLCFVAEHGEVVSLREIVDDAYTEMFRLEKATWWLPIDSAPKSTTEPTQHGDHVRGHYLLGFCPDEVTDPRSCIEIIWWEPHLGRDKTGAWWGVNDLELRPTHWMELPKPPKKAVANAIKDVNDKFPEPGEPLK